MDVKKPNPNENTYFFVAKKPLASKALSLK